MTARQRPRTHKHSYGTFGSNLGKLPHANSAEVPHLLLQDEQLFAQTAGPKLVSPMSGTQVGNKTSGFSSYLQAMQQEHNAELTGANRFEKPQPRMPGIESITTQDLSPQDLQGKPSLLGSFSFQAQAVMPRFAAANPAPKKDCSYRDGGGSVFSGYAFESASAESSSAKGLHLNDMRKQSLSIERARANKARSRLRESSDLSSVEDDGECAQRQRVERLKSPIEVTRNTDYCLAKMMQLQLSLEQRYESSPFESLCEGDASDSMATCQCGRRHYLTGSHEAASAESRESGEPKSDQRAKEQEEESESKSKSPEKPRPQSAHQI